MSEDKAAAFPPDLCVTDRRANDRRKRQIPVALERRSGKERRDEKGERRRQIDPTTCERDYTNDEIEFMKKWLAKKGA